MTAAATPRKNPFHLVAPSPWPIAGAVAVLVLALGGVRIMHGGQPWLFAGGGVLLAGTLAAWWRDVVREAGAQQHTERVRIGLREGMALFIASEVMFFVAFFWAFFYNALRLSPLPQWPPSNITPLDAWSLPAWNTLILLASGVVLALGMRAFTRHGDRMMLVLGIAAAIVLGSGFLVLQAIEYGHAAFAFKDGVYPSVFYMATGFHGVHVLIGLVFLAVCLGRAAARQFTPEHHVGLQAAAWYWHFVDVVWLFLFVWVYWWGNG